MGKNLAVFAAAVCAAAVTAGQAPAAGNVKTPANMRAVVLRLAATCRSFPGAVSCAGDPAVFRYFDRRPARKRPPAYSRYKALYRSAIALCAGLRPSRRDGPSNMYNLALRPDFVDLQCLWGGSSGSINRRAVVIFIDVPLPGHTMARARCGAYPYDTPVDSICRPVAGGVQAATPYNDIAEYSKDTVDTVNGYAAIQRWTPVTAEYNQHVAGDRKVFAAVLKALDLPSMS